jgi:hypothetical protein
MAINDSKEKRQNKKLKSSFQKIDDKSFDKISDNSSDKTQNTVNNFYSKKEGKLLETRLVEIEEKYSNIPVHKSDNYNSFFFIVILVFLVVLFYLLYCVKNLKSKVLSIGKVKIDSVNTERRKASSNFSDDGIYFEKKMDDLKNQIFREIEKNNKEFSLKILELSGNRGYEAKNPDNADEIYKEQVITTYYSLYFEPTVNRTSSNGSSIFTAHESVQLYDVFQLDVEKDSNSGFFYFNQSFERGKNDVASDLRKLFHFADYSGTGTRRQFITIQKGKAKRISETEWEVVEKAKIDIS